MRQVFYVVGALAAMIYIASMAYGCMEDREAARLGEIEAAHDIINDEIRKALQ